MSSLVSLCLYLDNRGEDEHEGQEDEVVEGRRVRHLWEVSAGLQPQKGHR